MKKAFLAVSLCAFFFIPLLISRISVNVSTPKGTQQESDSQQHTAVVDYSQLSVDLSKYTGRNISMQFLETLENDSIDSIMNQMNEGISPIKVDNKTLNVMLAEFCGEIDGKHVIDKGSNGKNYFELGFVGDMNFTEDNYIMPHANTMANGILDCVDEKFKSAMNDVDIMLANNEFAYSDRGAPLANKQFTFCARPGSVKYMTLLGIDIVSLANNHTYDYGADAFEDTMKTLDNEGIPYIGAGNNFDEASRETSFIINGCKVGYLAASRAEMLRLTPVAGKDSEGIFGCYGESEELIKAIGDAKSRNDYVIVYVHWGTEYSTDLSDSQLKLAKAYIDAGASAVVGAHPHILQGMQFYNGCPIIYSLGNFLFSSKTLDSGMIKLRFENGSISLNFIPGRQENCEVHYVDYAEQRRTIFDRIIKISPEKIKIDDNGNVTPAA